MNQQVITYRGHFPTLPLEPYQQLVILTFHLLGRLLIRYSLTQRCSTPCLLIVMPSAKNHRSNSSGGPLPASINSFPSPDQVLKLIRSHSIYLENNSLLQCMLILSPNNNNTMFDTSCILISLATVPSCLRYSQTSKCLKMPS